METTSITNAKHSDNEKLSTLPKCCESCGLTHPNPLPKNENCTCECHTEPQECAICKEMHNKGGMVWTLRYNCTFPCHTEPQEVAEKCECKHDGNTWSKIYCSECGKNNCKDCKKKEVAEKKYKHCCCPKGGGYEREDGSIEICKKCGGSEWIEEVADWEKEFEKFLNGSKYPFLGKDAGENIKSFITKTIEQEREKLIDLVDNRKKFIEDILEDQTSFEIIKTKVKIVLSDIINKLKSN